MAKLRKAKGVISYSNSYTGNSTSFSTSSSQGGGGNNAPFMGGQSSDFVGQATHDRVKFTDRSGHSFGTGRIQTASVRGSLTSFRSVSMVDSRGLRRVSNIPVGIIGR